MNPIDADKLERLLTRAPKHTQNKIQGLIDQAVAAGSAASHASDLQREEWALFVAAEAGFLAGEDIEKARVPFGEEPKYEKGARFNKKNEEWFARERERVLDRWRAWKRKQTAFERCNAERESWAFLSDIQSWLGQFGDGRDHPLHGLKPPAVKLAKGKTHADAVEDIRRQIEHVDARIDETLAAPTSAAEAIDAMNREVERIAASGAVTGYASGWDRAPFNLTGGGIRYGGEHAVGVTGETITWLFADEIKAKLADRIREMVDGPGLTTEEREAAIKQMKAQRLELERQEEAHIVAAAESGQHIPRRREADPRAILEVVE